jgi:hypothetical protein
MFSLVAFRTSLSKIDDQVGTFSVSINFEPGTRIAWHPHPFAKTLIGTYSRDPGHDGVTRPRNFGRLGIIEPAW